MTHVRLAKCAYWIVIAAALSAAGCSKPNDSNFSQTAAGDSAEPTETKLYGLFDPASLVEIESLRDLPADLQAIVRAAGVADAGEPCNDTDAWRENTPRRCFFLGGVSSSSALVAFHVGSIGGPMGVARAYVRDRSQWKRVKSWCVNTTHHLSDLLERVSKPLPLPTSLPASLAQEFEEKTSCAEF
jgi:hypothetical protein